MNPLLITYKPNYWDLRNKAADVDMNTIMCCDSNNKYKLWLSAEIVLVGCFTVEEEDSGCFSLSPSVVGFGPRDLGLQQR